MQQDDRPGVDIPDGAWDAVVKVASIDDVLAANGSPSRITDLIEKAVKAAASPTVAAELERIVADTSWGWAVSNGLLARAKQLRGDA